jgi:hypothetical protein
LHIFVARRNSTERLAAVVADVSKAVGAESVALDSSFNLPKEKIYIKILLHIAIRPQRLTIVFAGI